VDAIVSTKVVLPDGIAPAAIMIANGKIEAVLPQLPPLFNGVVNDVGHLLIMPGVIDPHVHINEPGRTDWEGFNTATLAALAGGVTTIVDMPLNASPVTTSVAALEQKLHCAREKIHVHTGFWGGVVPDNASQIVPLIEAGVLGFKAFLTHSGISDFPNVTEAALHQVMPVLAKYQLPLLVHCELSDDIQRSTPMVCSYQNYLNTRPKEWEDEAIALMIALCKKYNCRTHIVHLSSAASLVQIQLAKQQGYPLSVETGQHYLYFNAEDIKHGQTQFKCAPPIRERANNELLWQALQQGNIDFVATDHSPATPALKEIESGDFIKAWGGIASLQFALPILWTAAKKRNCSITSVVKWLCENPAKLAGLENTKGKIAAGFDADLIVLDEEKTFTITTAMIQHKHKITPYLGETLYGVVAQTYLNGEKVYDNGEFVGLNRGKVILR
jgi:allantoinase